MKKIKKYWATKKTTKNLYTKFVNLKFKKIKERKSIPKREISADKLFFEYLSDPIKYKKFCKYSNWNRPQINIEKHKMYLILLLFFFYNSFQKKIKKIINNNCKRKIR